MRTLFKWFTRRIKERFHGRQRDEMLWQIAALYGSLGLYDPLTIVRLWTKSIKPTFIMLLSATLPLWFQKLILTYTEKKNGKGR